MKDKSPKSSSTFAKDRFHRSIARIQLEVLAEKLPELGSLMHITGCRTKRELYEDAYIVFRAIIRQVANGKQVGFIDVDAPSSASENFIPLLHPRLEDARSYYDTLAGKAS